MEGDLMDPNRMTQSTQAALHDAQTKALRYGHAEIEIEHAGGARSPYVCEKCGGQMLYRISKNGFFLACENRECGNTKPVDQQGKIRAVVAAALTRDLHCGQLIAEHRLRVV